MNDAQKNINWHSTYLTFNDKLPSWKAGIIKKYLKKNMNLLDVGCGTGQLLNTIKIKNYHGIDLNSNFIKKLKQKRGNKFSIMTLPDLNFADDTFDLTVCFSTIYYVKDWKKSLKEMIRITKPEGKIIVEFLPISLRNWYIQIKYKLKGINNYLINKNELYAFLNNINTIRYKIEKGIEDNKVIIAITK